MVLFRKVVKAFHLSDKDLALTLCVDLIRGYLVSATLAYRDLFENTVVPHGFFKKPQTCGLVSLSG